jgi:putative transposase
MRGSRRTEEQIIGILKQAEKGMARAESCRQEGISEQTFYRWNAKNGGLASGDAKKLKQLEEENRKLKYVVSELTLDNRALKDALKKLVEPTSLREAASYVAQQHAISERHACRLVEGARIDEAVPCSPKRAGAATADQGNGFEPTAVRLPPGAMLAREEKKVNHKRIYRL